MENFNEFKIETPEVVFGGYEQTETRYSTGTTGGRDIYDDGIIVYFPPDEQY